MPGSFEEVSLGHTIFPMLSKRTSCKTLISDMERLHENLEEYLGDDVAVNSSLGVKFPAFICEVKLDGERMIVHVNRGIVTMQVNHVSMCLFLCLWSQPRVFVCCCRSSDLLAPFDPFICRSRNDRREKETGIGMYAGGRITCSEHNYIAKPQNCDFIHIIPIFPGLRGLRQTVVCTVP